MDIIFFAITLLTFYSLTLTHSEWVIHPENTMPRDDTMLAIGSYNDLIYLLGGLNKNKQQTIYDIKTDSFVFYKSQIIPNDNKISGEAQFWTQIQFNLYFLNDFDPQYNKISVFNLKDNSFISDFNNIPITVSDGMGRACVTSSSFYNSIYINGGITASGIPKTETYILNMDYMQWSLASQMTTARRSHTCIVHPNNHVLYSIGGSTTDSALTASIEKLPVENSYRAQWTYLNDELTNPSKGLRSVIYGNYIIIIGGLQSSRTMYDTMHLIDTTTDALTISNLTLARSTAYSAVIMVNDIMYSFGGGMGDDMWQSNSEQIIFTTTPTTTAPTLSPTTARLNTSSPTMVPTGAVTTDMPTIQQLVNDSNVTILTPAPVMISTTNTKTTQQHENYSNTTEIFTSTFNKALHGEKRTTGQIVGIGFAVATFGTCCCLVLVMVWFCHRGNEEQNETPHKFRKIEMNDYDNEDANSDLDSIAIDNDNVNVNVNVNDNDNVNDNVNNNVNDNDDDNDDDDENDELKGSVNLNRMDRTLTHH